MTEPMISLSGLRKSYAAHEVLKGVSLEVAPGEVRVLIGPSGCGKSTLLRCINLLEQPDSGVVKIGVNAFAFGGNAAPPPARALEQFRSRVGMVFQQFDLFPHMTALQNVMAGPRIVKKTPAAEARDLARSLLAKVGLADKADSLPRNLSGGQSQRVAIARALAMEPDILLFDEPTSALDPELVGEVLDVMQMLAEGHTTMIVVTHEVAFASEAAGRIVFMDHGRIIETAAPDVFFSRPKEERSRRFLDRTLSRYALLGKLAPRDGA